MHEFIIAVRVTGYHHFQIAIQRCGRRKEWYWSANTAVFEVRGWCLYMVRRAVGSQTRVVEEGGLSLLQEVYDRFGYRWSCLSLSLNHRLEHLGKVPVESNLLEKMLHVTGLNLPLGVLQLPGQRLTMLRGCNLDKRHLFIALTWTPLKRWFERPIAMNCTWRYNTADTDPFSSKDSSVWGTSLYAVGIGVCTGGLESSWQGIGVEGIVPPYYTGDQNSMRLWSLTLSSPSSALHSQHCVTSRWFFLSSSVKTIGFLMLFSD